MQSWELFFLTILQFYSLQFYICYWRRHFNWRSDPRFGWSVWGYSEYGMESSILPLHQSSMQTETLFHSTISVMHVNEYCQAQGFYLQYSVFFLFYYLCLTINNLNGNFCWSVLPFNLNTFPGFAQFPGSEYDDHDEGEPSRHGACESISLTAIIII